MVNVQKTIIWTLYCQGFSNKAIRDKLIKKFPTITEKFIEEEIYEMQYILQDEESKLGYYKQLNDEEQQFKQLVNL